MRAGFFDHHEPLQTISVSALNASGNGQGFLGPVPQGYCWYIENVTMRVPNQGVLDMIISPTQKVPAGTAWDFSGRFDLFAAATDDARNYASPIYVGPGMYIVASVTGGTQNDTPTISLQIAVHQLNPAFMTSPEDARQIQAAHQHATREHAELSHSYATGDLAV